MATTYDQPPMQTSSTDLLNRVLARSYTINWEMVAYVVIFLLAVFTRFYDLGTRVMSHDESLHTRYSFNLYNEGNFEHTPLMHGPILFHATAFSYFLFGDNDYTSRIYPALLGVLIVLSPLLFRHWIGRVGALLASIMFLISPIMLYYNRYIRHDTPSIFFALLMIWAILMYINGPLRVRRKGYWLYIIAIGMIGNLGSKETAFIYIAIVGVFLALYWFVRLAQQYLKWQGRPVFMLLMMGILIGALTALMFYNLLSIIPPETLNFNEPPTPSLAEAMFINWTGVFIVSTLVLVIGAALWAYRSDLARIRWDDMAIILLVAVIVLIGLVYFEEVSRIETADASEHAETLDPTAEAEITEDTTSILPILPIVGAWIVGALGIGVVVFGWFMGWWNWLKRFPEFDVMVIIGTLILPWATPVIIKLTGASATDYSADGIQRALLAFTPVFAFSVAVGLAWNWKRWLIAAAIFYTVFAFFFTTMFTNVYGGLATGMIGSLGYWLEQQEVRRGNQPQYYYTMIIMPFYEFLPVIGGFLATLAGTTLFWRYRRKRDQLRQQESALRAELAVHQGAAPEDTPAVDEPSLGDLVGKDAAALRMELDTVKDQRRRANRLTKIPVLLFISWWAILNLIGYTLAGEKMPWLATHLTTPLILLTGWYFGRVITNLDLRKFVKGGWLYLLLLPLLFVLLVQVFEPFVVGQSPFLGLEQAQLEALGEWMAIIFVGVIVTGIIIWLAQQTTGWRHLSRMIGVAAFIGLAVLTLRSAWIAAYINYDLAKEFLVYAHAAPSIKWTLHEIEDLSQRVTGGPDLRFAYDNETSWPNSWYFRNFPNAVFVGANPTPQNLNDAVAVVVGEANRSKVEPILEERYFHQDYIRMWWPMQDYFNLTADRFANTFDFSSENAQAAQIRRGLFDIWWSRNYSTYATALNANWTETQWPVSDRMHFYVRKDIAAQIWDLGVGERIAIGPGVDETVNVCVENWQPLAAELVFMGQGGVPFVNPVDVEVADGRVYIAEEFGNRISVLDTDGNYLEAIASQPESPDVELLFNRPNAVDVRADGRVYIADTWNYRIKGVSPDRDVVVSWGQPEESGFEVQQDPVDGFWGPRDVELDSAGNVYVADTGNKRVRVYSADGLFLRDIGSGGMALGQLDEPSGLDISADGELFVADTWNRRVSVFDLQGSPLYAFDIRGWYDDQGNRPYLAVDDARDIIYVTDPDAGRVLVYDINGNCVGSFGQSGDGAVMDNTQFQVASGIAVGDDGSVYVSDSGAGRVLKFAPFPVEIAAPVQQDAAATPELLPVTAEVTAESAEITGAVDGEMGSVASENTGEPVAVFTAEIDILAEEELAELIDATAEVAAE